MAKASFQVVSSLAGLRFSGVTKRYGDIHALDGLDLTVRRGEIYGLLGPNGAGKTTAIKVLVGLERRDGGEVEALGEGAPSRELLPRIGYMPQETALYDDLSVTEHVDLFGTLYGLRGDGLWDRADALLELVGLADRRRSVTHELSGGMKHRLSLALALLHDPDLLLLDEPTVGVDPALRARFWEHFRGLRDAGKTILVTTHYMDEAKHCDRVGLLRAGRLLAEGSVRDVLDHVGGEDLEDAFLRISRGDGREGVGVAEGGDR